VNRNDGISISGGNVTAGAMAAGDNASASVSARGDVVLAAHPDVAPLLHALLAALARHRDELPGPAAAEAGEQLAAELAEPRPSPSRVKELLTTVTEGAGSVTAVVEAARAITGALAHLW